MGGRWKRDPYLPTVYRVGYHGEGEFIPSVRVCTHKRQDCGKEC